MLSDCVAACGVQYNPHCCLICLLLPASAPLSLSAALPATCCVVQSELSSAAAKARHCYHALATACNSRILSAVLCATNLLLRPQSELSSAAAKAAEEREFLRSLNETLLANQKEFGAKLTAAQAAAADKDAQLQDLQEQVRQRWRGQAVLSFWCSVGEAHGIVAAATGIMV